MVNWMPVVVSLNVSFLTDGQLLESFSMHSLFFLHQFVFVGYWTSSNDAICVEEAGEAQRVDEGVRERARGRARGRRFTVTGESEMGP